MFLVGCGAPAAQSSLHEVSEWPWFSMKTEAAFMEHILRDDGSVALTTYSTATTKREAEDFSIYLYPALSSACEKSITGASEMSNLTNANGEASWGRVDQWDSRTGDEDNDIDDNLVVCQNNGVVKYSAVYALCSQKDNKTVMICINQVTDSSQLAEDIFKTFRWTKE